MDEKTFISATGCSAQNAKIYAPLLTQLFAQYGIASLKQQAYFLGQVVAETGAFSNIAENPNKYSAKNLVSIWPDRFRMPILGAELNTTPVFSDGKRNAMYYGHNGVELANYVYQRKDLGNVNPGDGYKYIGRGLLQLTGRANYQKLKNITGLDLVNNPELLLEPK